MALFSPSRVSLHAAAEERFSLGLPRFPHMSGMSAVNVAAASTVSNGDPVLMQSIAGGLQLIHILQVYTSSMVSFFGVAQSSTFDERSQMAVAVWDWLVCIRGQFGIFPGTEGDSKRGSGMERDLEKTMVTHQGSVHLDALLRNSMLCIKPVAL
jgi:hypothetical protein